MSHPVCSRFCHTALHFESAQSPHVSHDSRLHANLKRARRVIHPAPSQSVTIPANMITGEIINLIHKQFLYVIKITEKMLRDLSIQTTIGPDKCNKNRWCISLFLIFVSLLFTCPSPSLFTCRPLSLSLSLFTCLSLSLFSCLSLSLSSHVSVWFVCGSVGVCCVCGSVGVCVLVCVVWHAEKLPCVDSKCPRVYVQNVPRVCRHHAHVF